MNSKERKAATYRWPKASSERQELSISVKYWKFVVAPYLISNDTQVSFEFEWQGVAQGAALEGVLVLGRIAVYEPGDTPGMLSDFWTNAPKNPNGVGSLLGSAHRPDTSVSIDLYCRPVAFRLVRDLFASGFATSERGVRLDVSLGQPDLKLKDKDYWDTTWHADRWEVVQWRAVLESSIDGYERL